MTKKEEQKSKIKETLKSKKFWGYILTGVGGFLAGTADLTSFIAGLFNWFD